VERWVVHLPDRYVPYIQYMVRVRDLVLGDYFETTKIDSNERRMHDYDIIYMSTATRDQHYGCP